MTDFAGAQALLISAYDAGLILNCIAIAVCGVLITAVLNENTKMERDVKYFTAFLIAIMVSAIVEAMICLTTGAVGSMGLIKALNVLGYTVNQTILFFYTMYMIENLNHKTFVSTIPLYVVAFIGAFMSIIWAASLYDWEFFAYYDAFGNLIKTDYFIISSIVPALILVFDAALAYSCRSYISHTELLSWISFIVFPIIGMVLNSFVPLELIQQGEALAALMIYANVHSETSRRMALQQKEITEARVKVMMSQIQPHFMYNSLNSIYYLIGKDPEIAQEAVSRFSSYLRSNINSLKSDEPVAFDTELNHVQTYLYLEKLRFDDELEIAYDIKEHDFVLPPLTLQPIVENAVKHGIGNKKGGGRITIHSDKKENCYEIRVEDDGIGFDPGFVLGQAEQKPDFKGTDRMSGSTGMDESTHIGVSNVKERLKTLTGGQLLVKSQPGKGTEVIIRIPMVNDRPDDDTSDMDESDGDVSGKNKADFDTSDKNNAELQGEGI